METQLLDRARTAFTERSWREAYDRFSDADRSSPLDPTDLERLATAAYLAGQDDSSTDAWTRAHQGWHEQGDEQRAVRCAFWLGFALVQRGDMAQGGGWLARAARMIDEHGLDTVERGYLLVPEALMALGSGEGDAALERFARAGSLARRFDDPDLATLSTLGQGQALLSTGHTTEGLRRFDEAMVAVTAGETSPTVSGLVYCAVIDACQHVFDLHRAHQWTGALDRWCEQQPGLVPYRGQCLVHRSQVLQIRGDWDGAATEAERALRWLSDPPHPAVGMAHYQLGELHRLRGDSARAEAAYRAAHAAGRDPHPGLALLRLSDGQPESAATAIEATLDEARDPMARARLLAAGVDIMVELRRPDEARAAAAELDELARGVGDTMLRAVADRARGAVLLLEGDARAALVPLRSALDGWQRLGAPYEAAQGRVLLAEAYRRLEDLDRAELEHGVARRELERLGARPALARLDRLVADPSPRRAAPDDDASTGHPVTGRELDVLRLVAAGQTNREIGTTLAISEKTVERHLANIFTKLDASNRAAATARAYDLGLL